MKPIIIYLLLLCLYLPAFSQGDSTLQLKDTQQLKAVVVLGQKPLFQQLEGGTVVNVQGNLMSKGSTVLEILERSPGVVIDRRNNNIALNGKQGVLVMLNGKLVRLPAEQVVSLLSGMQANEVATIELLSVPPASYDAEGDAGIINIVSRKNRQRGLSAASTLTGGYGWGEKAAAGVHIYGNYKKISSNISYQYSRDRTYSDLYIISAQEMPALGGKLEVLGTDTTQRTQNNHEATAGITLRPDSSTSIEAGIIYNSSLAAYTSRTSAQYNILPDSLLLFDGTIDRANSWKNLASSLSLEKLYAKEKRLNMGIENLYFRNNNPSLIQSSFINKEGNAAGNNDSLFSPMQKGSAGTSINVNVIKMDYRQLLNKRLRLEAGIKASYTAASSSSWIASLIDNKWVNRTETNNKIMMKERIGAAYISVNAQIDQSLRLVVGLRHEYAVTKMNDPVTSASLIDRKQGVLFPNISFSKKISDISEWQLSYSKRISRPSYNDLASYSAYSDPTAVYTGNPLLKPAISNNIRLAYNYKNYSFAILAGRDDESIARYQLTESPQRNLLYVSPQNIPRQNNINLTATLPIKINDWWKMNYSVTGGWRELKINHTIIPAEKKYFFYSMNLSESFSFAGGYAAELSGWYNSLSYNGSAKVNGFGTISAAFKKELKRNAGTFQLSVTDILGTMRVHSFYGTVTQEAFFIQSDVRYNTESTRSPVIKLTYSRSFGVNTNRKSIHSNEAAVDESERIRKE